MPFCHLSKWELKPFLKLSHRVSSNCACGKIFTPEPARWKSALHCVLNSLPCVSISSVLIRWQYSKFLAKAFEPPDNLKLKFQTARSKSKRSFNSSLEGTQLDVWCEKTPGQSERVQNSRLTLSHWALWKLSHNNSPAVISSSSLPCHPFFQRWRKFPCSRENQQHSPREADIPRTSTSAIRSSVGPGLRTILWNVGDSSIASLGLKFYEFNKLLELPLFGGVGVWLTDVALIVSIHLLYIQSIDLDWSLSKRPLL